MRNKLEKESEKLLRREIKKLGGLCYKFVSPGNVGVPDRIIILFGWVFFAEMKTKNGKLTSIQKRQIDKLKDQGQSVTVIYGDSGVRKFIDFLKNKIYINDKTPEEFR